MAMHISYYVTAGRHTPPAPLHTVHYSQLPPDLFEAVCADPYAGEWRVPYGDATIIAFERKEEDYSEPR